MAKSLCLLFLFLAACATASKGAQPPEFMRADWCSHFAPGTPSREPIPIALSRAHALRRFFGKQEKYSDVDSALVRALQSEAMDLGAYAESLPETCWLPAKVSPTPQTILRFENGVAIIELENYPNSPEADAFFLKTIRDLLQRDVAMPDQTYRTHHGMTDEFFHPRNLYRNHIELRPQPPIHVQGTFDGPLVFKVKGPLSPKVTEIVGSLRLAERAHFVGDAVSSAPAESIWMPIGNAGLAFRVSELSTNGKRWPETFEADDGLRFFPLALGSQRSPLLEMTPFKDKHPAPSGFAEVRAALFIAHGALRLFYPLFEVLGDRIDASLVGSLAEIPKEKLSPIESEKRHLRLLSASLNDGHSFVFSQNNTAEYSYAALSVETLEGRVFVRRSRISGVLPGDELLKKGDQSIPAFYREELPLVSASSDGYRYDIANRQLIRLSEPTSFVIATGKKERRVLVQPIPFSVAKELQPGVPSLRANGWLKDLGKPNIFYLNLNGPSTPKMPAFKEELAKIKANASTQAVILDMRGYPELDMNEVARHLVCKPFASPRYRTIHRSSPFESTIDEESSSFEPYPEEQSYCGPLALLVGAHTVSSAEDFSTVMVDAGRVSVRGTSASAGSNGNIAGIQLPGGFVVTFSGMEVRHADGRIFVGQGIRPERLTNETAVDFAAGRDRVLVDF